jgi:hypothetical protein
LRIELPDGTENLAWLRVELWHDNEIPPPSCLAGPAPGRVAPAGEPSQDVCTRMSVEIWNLVGELVRWVPDTTAHRGGLSWPWDGRNDEGSTVPSGYYPMFAECLDSQGSFTLTGHYFWWNPQEEGACQWPLWIQEIRPSPEDRVLRFGPFPLEIDTRTFHQNGLPKDFVLFANPYLVRVRAPGRIPFEEEIVLVDEAFTTVSVRLVPES